MTYPITIKRRVTVDLDADAWELFTVSMDCTKAARALNVAASKALSLPTRDEAWELWSAASEKWADYGAADSEPRYVFRDLLDQVFGID